MQTLEEERQLKKTKSHELAAIKSELGLQAKIMGALLSMFWGSYLVNNLMLDNWVGENLAIKAGTLEGLLGVFVTPFLHITPAHAIGSSVALLVLGWWVMLRDTRDFFIVHAAALVSSGLALWLFDDGLMRWFGWGGVAFGMAGYLMTAGVFERRVGTILSSVVAIALLGGLVTSAMMPGAALGTAGLIGGFAGGVASAAYLGRRRKKIADPVDLVGSARKAAEVQFDFREDDNDAISHLQAESRRIRVRG